MIWFGLMFLAGAVYNLFIGDYLNSIVGGGIALALVGLGTIWTEQTSNSERVKSTAIVLLTITIFSSVLYGVVNEIEINTEAYETVASYKATHEETGAIINSAMEDGKITLPELYEIKEIYNDLRKESAISSVSEKRD